MKKKVFSIMGLSFLLAAFGLAVVPAQAQNVEQKIQALEQELSALKSDQMELKKEATAAAAAMPTFSYRTGFLGITAADKSWQLSTSFEYHAHMYNHIDGDDKSGFTTGDIFMRRNRPFLYYCWDNCLYEIGWGLDMDDGDIAASQTSRFVFNLDQINPWMPKIEVSDKGNEAVSYVQRSSGSGAVMELTRDMLSDSGYDTLSHAAIGIGWLNKKIGSGDFLLWTEYRVGAGFNKNTNSDTDRKQFFLKVGTRPFSQIKNKWLRGLKVGLGWIAESKDDNSAGGRRLRLRTDDRIGRIATMDANNIRGGDYYALFPGLEWSVGPYTFRTEMARSKYNNESTSNVAFNGNAVDGFAWSLQNELFLWSPKGFLTGSSRTPNSLLFGWSFKRSDMDCGSGSDCTPGTSTSSTGHLIKREWDIWYFLRPGLSVGMWWNWWSTPNMPTTLQGDVGCTSFGSERVGKNCDWHSVNAGLRANF